MAKSKKAPKAAIPGEVEPIPGEEDRFIPGRNGGTLRPFRPGESGNPSGKPKGVRNLKTLLRESLEGLVDYELNGPGEDGEEKTEGAVKVHSIRITRAEALVLEKIRLALSSPYDAVRLKAIESIFNRLEGTPGKVGDGEEEGTEDDNFVFYFSNNNSRKRKSLP